MKRKMVGKAGYSHVIIFCMALMLVNISAVYGALQWDSHKNKDADYWAPESYFIVPPKITGTGCTGFTTRIVPRVLGESNSADESIDRIYVTRDKWVHTYDMHGNLSWSAEVNSPIVTSPVACNFGNMNDWNESVFMIYFGCSDGRVHAWMDYTKSTENERPNNLTSIQLDGKITTEIVTYNTVRRDPATDNKEYTAYDRVLFGTDKGTVYSCTIGLDIVRVINVANVSIEQIVPHESWWSEPVLYVLSDNQKIYEIIQNGRSVSCEELAQFGPGSTRILIPLWGNYMLPVYADGKIQGIVYDTGNQTGFFRDGDGNLTNITGVCLANNTWPTIFWDYLFVACDDGSLWKLPTSRTPSWKLPIIDLKNRSGESLSTPIFDRLTYSILVIQNQRNSSILRRITPDGLFLWNISFSGVTVAEPQTGFLKERGYQRAALLLVEDTIENVTTLECYGIMESLIDQRLDTDGDGNPDITDVDDDNDYMLDVDDPAPKDYYVRGKSIIFDYYWPLVAVSAIVSCVSAWAIAKKKGRD